VYETAKSRQCGRCLPAGRLFESVRGLLISGSVGDPFTLKGWNLL